MSKKRILIFIDWFLPGYRAGGPIRSCVNMIEHLKEEYDFSVITRDTDYCGTIPYPGVKSNQWNVIEDGIRVYYFSSSSVSLAEMRRLIEQEKFDFIYLNGIYSWRFTILPLFVLKGENKKIILAVRGMLAESAIGQKQLKKRMFLLFARWIGLFKGITFQASTENEKNEVVKYFGNKVKIIVAPNMPRRNIAGNIFQKTKSAATVNLVNIARISPEKNLKYALETLIKVKGNVVFHFYGPVYDESYWNECKVILSRLPENIKVEYKGSIETDLIPDILPQYDFFFMPSRGENFGHIILEALSSGLPVIISNTTPWKNLEKEKAGWDFPLSEQAKVAEAIESCVLMDQAQYDLYSSSARKFALSYANNYEIIRQNKLLFQ